MNAQAITVAPDGRPRHRSRRARILVLEPNDRLRSWWVAELGLAGHEVLHAASARNGFDAWLGSYEPIDLLVMNPLTVRGEGLSLWSRLCVLQPQMPVVFPVISPDEIPCPTAAVKLVCEVGRVLGESG